MGTKTSPWIFFDDHIFTSGTRQGIILVGAIGQRTHKNAQMLVFILFRNALSAKKAQKDAAEKREKDKQVSLFQAMKDWEAKHGDISQFDASKVDVMSIHEQAALNVSSAESKYHKM